MVTPCTVFIIVTGEKSLGPHPRLFDVMQRVLNVFQSVKRACINHFIVETTSAVRLFVHNRDASFIISLTATELHVNCR